MTTKLEAKPINMRDGSADYRHGDGLLEAIDKLPSGLKPAMTNILLVGEATGHNHRINGSSGSYQILIPQEVKAEDAFSAYLQVNEPVTLTHEEHNSINLDPGLYGLKKEEEYDLVTKQLKQVRD
jgi:hypothetical protein